MRRLLFLLVMFGVQSLVSAEQPQRHRRTHASQRRLIPSVDHRQPLAEAAYFVDPDEGDDQGPGTQAQPWKTLRFAFRQLRPGFTLYLREGVYHELTSLTRSGTEDAPITIAAYPGEIPVLDGGRPEFLHSPNEQWIPNSEGVPGEYVSTGVYDRWDDRRVPEQFLPGAWEPMHGREQERPLALGHFADSMVPLHGYRTLEDLRSRNELNPGGKDQAAVYCGPGLWFNRDTGRIHVRLAHHRLPGLNDRAYRGETDPRRIPLVLSVGFGSEVLRISGIKHVTIRGLLLRGATGSPLIHVYGSEAIELNRLTAYGGFPGLLLNASRQIRIRHCAFRGLAAPWSGRFHMKYRGTASYQVILQDGQPFNENIEISNCELTDDHDGMFLRYCRNLQFHHNYVDNFNDDGLECGAKLGWHSLFIHHNRIGACLGTFQQHEIAPDESPADHEPGSGVYVFRNVFDGRAGVYYNLPREADSEGTYLHHEGEFLSDHGSPVYPVMKIYHNTFLRRTPPWRNYFLFGLGTRGLRSTERDVFNNLFVQELGTPGTVIPAGKSLPILREGGNGLWSLATGDSEPVRVFDRFRKSATFSRSRAVQPLGWTGQDWAKDPLFRQFPAEAGERLDLGLSDGSPAVDAGIDLDEDWPDPLRALDRGRPDVGAVPVSQPAWGVGVDGRIPLFGESVP